MWLVRAAVLTGWAEIRWRSTGPEVPGDKHGFGLWAEQLGNTAEPHWKLWEVLIASGQLRFASVNTGFSFFVLFCCLTCALISSVPVLPPQVDVLDGLGGGPQGEQAGQNRAGVDGRLQQECVPDQQDGAVAQRPESGHPSGHPLLGGRLLRPHRDGLSQQHRAQGQPPAIVQDHSAAVWRRSGSLESERDIVQSSCEWALNQWKTVGGPSHCSQGLRAFLTTGHSLWLNWWYWVLNGPCVGYILVWWWCL